MEAAALQDVPDLELFSRLDSISVPQSWKPIIAGVLLDLGERCGDVDRAILRHTFRAIQRDRLTLLAWRRQSRTGSIGVQMGTQVEHPVATSLLKRASSEASSRGQDLLILILVEAAIEPTSTLVRPRIRQLSEKILGSLKTARADASDLEAILGDATSLHGLILNVERYAQSDSSVLVSFRTLWKNWLCDKIHYWIATQKEAVTDALGSAWLVPDLAAPTVPLLGSDDSGDDGIEVPIVVAEAAHQEDHPRAAVAEAKARELTRASQCDILAHPDQFVPVELITGVVRAAVTAAEECLSAGKISEGEPFVALLLALATGLREMDLGEVRWCDPDSNDEGGFVDQGIDVSRPVMYRRVVGPANAVQPTEPLHQWLETWTDRIEWPIPAELYFLLRRLAPSAQVESGRCVLPSNNTDLGSATTLRETVSRLTTGALAGAAPFRMAFAANIARAMGPEVAQLIFSDTFSLSVAPTYYCAVSTQEVTTEIHKTLGKWFGESPELPWHGEPRFIGSRLILNDAGAKLWPKALRHRLRCENHRKSASCIDGWRAHRNYLMGALCAATGHRPQDALAKITLDQVVPEHAIVLLQDKQSDPLRKVRVAATGSRWLVELRDYLDRLIGISKNSDEPDAAALARAILLSEAPLFAVAETTDGPSCSAATLRACMPEILADVPNFYRHRLNQILQRRGVDPELRFAQLGWVVAPAYATADCSPMAACDLGERLGPHIDEILVEDGWVSAGKRITRWNWEGIPQRPLKDWKSVVDTERAQHAREIAKLREDLRDRRREVEQKILPRLADAFVANLPSLCLNESECRIERRNAVSDKPVELDESDYQLLVEAVRTGDERPADALETIATRLLLFRLIRQSHKKKVTCGVLPRRPILSITAEPSPFIPGLGLAVRHAESLRQVLLECMKNNRAHDRGRVALMSVLAWSAYRKFDWAQAILKGAATARRCDTESDTIRFDVTIEGRSAHVALGGTPAILLVRRGIDTPTAVPPDKRGMDEWISARLSDLDAAVARSATDDVVETLRAAGRLELSGPERLLMLEGAGMTTAAAERCIAQDDHWPVRTADGAVMPRRRASFEIEEREKTAVTPISHAQLEQGYIRLTGLLNPDTFPGLVGKKGDGQYGWRQALEKELQRLSDKVNISSALGLIVAFALHRLRYGGTRKKHLAHMTLHTEVTRFARPLLSLVGDRALQDMDGVETSQLYLATLKSVPSFSRPLVLEAIELFHQFMENVHHADSVAFDELWSFTGPRLARPRVGLLTDSEVTAVYEALLADIEQEGTRPDASPEYVRLASLRLMFFLLMEASGARPKSLRGLESVDVHLFGEGRDFIHLHRGAYGSTKTSTSLGFIPLEGDLWRRARAWVVGFLTDERTRRGEQADGPAPLFARHVGGRRRYSKSLLQERIASLVKWATNDSKATQYWLRKRRVMARHRFGVNGHGLQFARDMQHAMRVSGHAGIRTPLESYIFDPAVPLARSLSQGRLTSRAHVLVSSRLPEEPLDMAWLRSGGAYSDRRMHVVFERLAFAAMPAPAEERLAPPELRRAPSLLPVHVEDYARARTRGMSVQEASFLSGLSTGQADRLEVLAADLLTRRGLAPWRVEGLRHPRAVIKMPRRTADAKRILAQLSKKPFDELLKLAEIWVTRGHMQRLVDDDQGVLLANESDEAVARCVLENMGMSRESFRVDGAYPARLLNASVEAETRTARRRVGWMPALEWMLVMTWLYTRLVDS